MRPYRPAHSRRCRTGNPLPIVSSPQLPESENRAWLDVARTLISSTVNAVTFAGAGRNGRVFKVTSDEGPFAMKSYPPIAADGRDRQGTEYAALAFLNAAGQRATPRPLARNDESRVTLYEWIDGGTIDLPCDRDIDEAVASGLVRDARHLQPHHAKRDLMR